MRSHKGTISLFMVLFVGLLITSSVFGQSGTIRGVVVDAQGGVIGNTKVMAFDEAKQLVVHETTSSEDGSFQLQPLQRGTYTVKAENSGFKALERKGLVLDPYQVMNLGRITLELGEITQSVTVEAQVPLVETSSALKSFTIDSQQVRELSLNGRDFQSLIRTLPGVVSNDRSDFRLAFNNTDAFNVNGLRGSANNVYLDGSINTDVGANDGQYTQISLDAVGEFKVQTSAFNAEYGRNPGVLLSITTRSGGREFHGTAYEFLRNNAMDARQPFDTTGTTPKLRFNQFGANLGGPILKRGLFFFFNYEGTRATRPGTGNNFRDLPHPDLLNGDFRRFLRGTPIATAPQFDIGTVFRPGTITRNAGGQITGGVPYPDNIIPRAEWSRNAPAFLKILSAFDRSGGQPVANSPQLVRVPFLDSYKFDKNAKVLRIDWAPSARTNLFFRWADDSQREDQTQGIFASTPYPVFPQYRKKPGSSWSGNLVNVISPSTTNEFIFTYNHLTQVVDVTETADTSLYDRDKLGFTFKELYPAVNVRNKFPRFNCGVGDCAFGGFASGWLSEGKTYAWTDNFTRVLGSHTFKTGVFFNHNDNGQQPAWTDSINIDFSPNRENPNDSNNTLANLLLGNYTSITQTNGIFYGSFRFYGLEFYGQDTWKVNRKLTLEYGGRYVFLGPTYTLGKFLQPYFDPARYNSSKAVQIETASGLRNGSIIPNSGDPFNGIVIESYGIPKGFAKHRKNQVSPRFGFAYDPWGDGKTSIRGGFGNFFERIRQNVNSFDGLANPPLTYNPRLYGSNVDSLSPDLVSGGTRFPVALTAFDAEGLIPTIYTWSLGVQRELSGKTSIDLGYIGNTARHLQYRKDINQLPLGTTTNTPILQQANNTANAVRPFKGFTNINFTDFGANSNYHALQARLSRRFASNLAMNANYTWSKSISEVDNDSTAIGYYLDRGRERGPAGFDRRHVFTLDYIYQLPNVGSKWMNNAVGRKVFDGWQVSGITRFWSGTPLTITSNGDPGTLGGGVRADYLSGDFYPTKKSREEYFNPLVFARPLNGSLGTTGKGILYGPGINNWDISLFKNTKISERITTQLRLETFNTFNHTQWAGINTGISGANPGSQVTAATRGTSGQVNSTRDPRNIQIGLKIYF